MTRPTENPVDLVQPHSFSLAEALPGGPVPPHMFRPSRQAHAFFLGQMANLLENQRGDFHYSVIGRFATASLASGYVGCHLLNDSDAALNPTVGLRGKCAERTPSRAHESVTKGLSPQSGRLLFQTGKRKIQLNDCDCVKDIEVGYRSRDSGLMRTDKNIHATYPPYATVAPILRLSLRKFSAGRGFTSNNGAADADGR